LKYFFELFYNFSGKGTFLPSADPKQLLAFWRVPASGPWGLSECMSEGIAKMLWNIFF